MPDFESQYPLNPLVKGWIKKIRLAEKFKHSHFQDQADEAMKFYECGQELNDLMWNQVGKRVPGMPDDEDLPAPKFRMVVGKASEVVQLFGPALYHRNPSIVVEPKTLEIPMDLLISTVPPEVMQRMQQQSQAAQQQAQAMGQPPPPPFNPQMLFPPDPSQTQNKIVAQLLNYFLDYIQRENSKYKESRRMIDEALIKGAGLLWTEEFQHYETGPQLIGSFYDTIDNLLIDPDAETVEEALWIARRCFHPIWEVAERYQIDEDWLAKRYGTHESATAQGETQVNSEWNKDRKIGKTNDLITYWKIYSKMGMGHKLSGLKDSTDMDQLDEFLDSMGQNVYIVVAEKVPYPLNLKQANVKKLFKTKGDKHDQKKEQMFQKCQWPIPFWADGEWPFTMLAFHEVPNNPWPMSHLKPALGQLKFMNWTMSFLANKIRTVCRTVGVVMKGVSSELTQRMLSGKDFEVLEVAIADLMGATSPDVSKLVQFLQMPPFHGDIWRVIEAVSEQFDKATGLTELAYGTPGGMRSAAEAQAKQGNMNIRPDDMANKVEDIMSLIARKEAMAARWLLEPESLVPILGERNTQLWEQYVMSGDVNKVAREYNYRVEAGSTRKPNKETQQANINQAIQQWMPLIQFELQKGNVEYANAFVTQWCKAFDIEEKPFLLPPPPPQPNPEMMKIQAEMEQAKMEGQLKQQEGQQRMQEGQQKLQMEIRKQEMDIAAKQQEMQLDAAAQQQEIGLEREKMQSELAMQRQQAQMDLQSNQMELGMKLKTQQALGAQKLQQGQLDIAQQAVQGRQQMAHDQEAHRAKIQMAKQQAAAKPKKPKGKK